MRNLMHLPAIVTDQLGDQPSDKAPGIDGTAGQPPANRAARRAESRGQVDKNPAHAPRTLGHAVQQTKATHSSFAFRRT